MSKYIKKIWLAVCCGVLPCAVIAQQETEAAVENEAAERDSYLVALEQKAASSEWLPLFNGENLDGWTAKFSGYEAGENLLETFRVNEGLLCADYSNWTEPFAGEFGHLYADGSYSHYILRVEYRFIGDQIEAGPGWAWRNNGLMLHGEAPEEIDLDQDFPSSLEVQLLGGRDGGGGRTTGNLCTPGTHVHMNGELLRQHVINSSYAAHDPTEWTTVEVVVNGAEEIRHYVEGEEVMRYQQLVLDENDPYAKQILDARQAAGNDSASLGEGSISIQAETNDCQFRTIEILPLTAADFAAIAETP